MESRGAGALDVAVLQHAEEPPENEVCLVVELLKRGREEDEIKGDPFVQRSLGLHFWRDHKPELVPT